MYKIVLIKNSYYNQKTYYNKYICILNDSNFLCYMKIFIIWFLHVIRLVKSGRQFVLKIIYIQDFVYYTLSD